MKRPITKDNVFKTEPYKSILNLLSLFQKHKGGMEQKHFRYALIRNHDIRTPQNKEGLDKWAIAECEGFFKNFITRLLRDNLIKEGCVTSRNNLNGFLNRLLELEVIERNEKSRYLIKKDYFIVCERIRCNDILNSYPTDNVILLDLREKINHFLFGFSDELTDLEEKKDIQYLWESLKSIENILESIESLKNKYVLRLYTKKIKKLITNYGNEEFKRFFSHPYICLERYFEGYGPDEDYDEQLILLASDNYEKTIDAFNEYNNFDLTLQFLFVEELNDEKKFREIWGLTVDEFWNVYKLIETEMKSIFELLSPISYVYYPKFGKNLLVKNVEEIIQVLKGSE